MNQLTETELAAINPGILKTVQWLREQGFNTVDSGDGKTADFECDLPYPYVHISVDPEKLVSETDRLISLIMDKGIDLLDCPNPQIDRDGYFKYPKVEAIYLPLQGGFAGITISNVVIE